MRFADFDLASLHSPSTYPEAVQRLADDMSLIPKGWHSIFCKCIQSLMAIRCSSRDNIHFHAPSSELGVLSVDCFDPNGAAVDRAVLGILRKLCQKSICTCEQCGRRACATNKYVKHRTLCTRCTVPVAMKTEIQGLQTTLRIGKWSDAKRYDIIPLRKFLPHLQALIPESKVRHLRLDDSLTTIEYITFADLQKLEKQLTQVETYLDQHCLTEQID